MLRMPLRIFCTPLRIFCTPTCTALRRFTQDSGMATTRTNTDVPLGDGTSVCLLSLFCTHTQKRKINGREVAAQSRKKFSYTLHAVSCKRLMLQAKQCRFGGPARCSGRKIMHSSTLRHPSPFIPQEKPLD